MSEPTGAGAALSERSITIVLPGPATFDGSTYRAFRPYARLANTLLGHFGRVIVSTQVLGPSSAAFGGNDAPFDPRVEVHALPEPPASVGGMLGNLRYQFRRGREMLRRMRGWETIYAFIPSYPGAIAYTVNRLFARRPAAVYLANDWEEIAPYMFRWRGWRRALFLPPYRFLLTRWERWIMGDTRLGITAGRALLAKYGGAGRPVYETVPLLEMGVDDMVQRADTCQGSTVRMLYVGTLAPRKGLPILLQAIRTLVDEGRELHLDLVGTGEERASLEASAAALGIADRLTFHGFVPHGDRLFGLYREADLFVLPTYSEGFPRVLYEALGHSVPVIASAVSGIPHLLRDGEHALLVPAGDPAALARAIARVIDDGELRRHLIREGYALVEPIISRDAAEQFVELYSRHLAASAPEAAR